ncbi:hypothetical protein DL769_005388 [Monosporascus sp. CRB-8-3]|nr:hypothetical protein DL769_005388 [Monosporascus sp. CRB-8-3]
MEGPEGVSAPPQKNLNLSITDNVASDGANQDIKLILKLVDEYHIECHLHIWGPADLDEALTLREVRDYLTEEVRAALPSRANPMSQTSDTPDGSSYQQESQTNGCTHNGDFPELTRWSDVDYAECMSRYRDDGEKGVIQKLHEACQAGGEESNDFDPLTLWRNSKNSSILTIDGSGNSSIDWTTRMAVEMIEDLEAGQEMRTSVFHYFCGERSEEKGPQPEVVVEDLLDQLLERHKSNFDNQAWYLTSKELRVALDGDEINVSELWDVFNKCVARARIRSLVIVLDNLHALFEECKRCDGKEVKRFWDFVDGLLLLSKEQFVVKIMVTSRSSEMLEEIRRDCNTG